MKKLICTIIVCTSFSCYAAQAPKLATRGINLGDTGAELIPKSVKNEPKKTFVSDVVRRNSNPMKKFNASENIVETSDGYSPGRRVRDADIQK